MLAFHEFILWILGIKIRIREAIVEFDIHVRILLDEYWLSAFLTRPEERFEPHGHLQYMCRPQDSGHIAR